LDVPIEQVTPKKVQAYIDRLLAMGLSAKTINCHLDSIRRFYNWLDEEDLREIPNPVKRGLCSAAAKASTQTPQRPRGAKAL
jgi:site-specific recombinase XerD